MHRGLKITIIFILIQLAAAAIGLAGSSPAPDTSAAIIPLITGEPDNGSATLPDHSHAVIRQRVVTVDATALTGGTIPRALALRLFPDIQYTAQVLWTESGPEDGLAWIGRLTDHPNSRITLVANRDQVSATIRVQGRRYDLRPLENGSHVVQQIDSDALPAGANPATGIIRGMSAAADETLARSDIMVDEERQVLDLVNEERSKVGGLSPLVSDDRLTAAARGHSLDMSNQNYFSHDSLDGRTFADRIEDAGYDRWSALGENIAYGYTTPEAVMNGWMNSSGHRANILGDSYCDLGVGYAADGHYWTQDFGRWRGVTACTAANQDPNAAFTAQPSSGPAPLPVALDAGDSDDPDGDDLSYTWDLGDGQGATTASLVHTFTVAGLYTVRLTVDDGHGGSDTTQQQITVTSAVNTAPQARDDAYACDQGHALSVPAPGVLDNDEDEQNATALAAVLVTAPAHGTLLLSTDGAFDYQPPPDFSGQEQFSYRATDGQFQSPTATVTITVQGVDPPPAGSGDTGSVSDGSGGSSGCFIHALPHGYPSGQ